MYYRVNIAIDGCHYFATERNSIRRKEDAIELAKELTEFYTGKYGVLHAIVWPVLLALIHWV